MTPPDMNAKPVALVTGAGGQLGPVWVRGLLESGWRVAALTLPGVGADPSLIRLAAAFGDSLQVLDADVTSRADLDAAVAQVLSSWGSPRALVNNAGIDQPPVAGRGTRIEDIDPVDFLKVLQVNALGAFQCVQAVYPAMPSGGAIVNIGSLYASVSPDQRFYSHLPMVPPFLKPPAYGASKAGLVNLTRYLATHLAPRGIRVNALSPGGVVGNQDPEFLQKFSARVPMDRLAEPEELIGPLLFLLSDAASYVTGIDLKVDGGFTAW